MFLKKAYLIQSEKQDVNLPPHNKIKSQSVEWNRIGNEMEWIRGKGGE